MLAMDALVVGKIDCHDSKQIISTTSHQMAFEYLIASYHGLLKVIERFAVL